jgi:hypothetical protein
VGPLFRRFYPLEFELQPIPFLQKVNPAVERQEELQSVVQLVLIHILSRYDSAAGCPAGQRRLDRYHGTRQRVTARGNRFAVNVAQRLYSQGSRLKFSMFDDW